MSKNKFIPQESFKNKDYKSIIKEAGNLLDGIYEFEVDDKEKRKSRRYQEEYISHNLFERQKESHVYEATIATADGKKGMDPRYISMKKCLCLDGRTADRRKQSVLRALEAVSKKYADLYPDVDTNKIYMDLQTNSLTSPNMLDKHSGLLVAVALYIIDYTFLSNQYDDLVYILDSHNIPEWRDEPFAYKTYATDRKTLKKLLTLLYYRNVPGKVTSEVKNMLMMDGRAAERTLTYKGNPKECSEYREILNEILDLIQPEEKSRTERLFTEKVNEHIDFTMEYMVKQYEKALKSLKKIAKDVNEMGKHVADLPAKVSSIPQLSPLLMPEARFTTVSNIMKDRIEKIPQIEELTTLKNKVSNVIYQLNSVNEIPKYRGTPLIHMESTSNGNEYIDEDLHKEWDKIEYANPYDICFGFFLLLDKGDDIAWLFGNVSPVLTKMCDLLPWGLIGLYDWDDEKLSDIITKEEESYSETEMTYLCLYGKQDDEFKESLQQYIYRKTGIIVPPRIFSTDDEHTELKDDGVTEQEIPWFLILKQLANDYFRVTNSQEKSDKEKHQIEEKQEQTQEIAQECPKETIETESEEALKETIRKQKEEIDRLKKLTYQSKKDAENEKIRADAVRADREMERKELSDLRELLFKLRNGNEEIENTPEEEQIELPYETAGKVVVFGGHENWLKKIKPMLPNVRFVSEDSSSLEGTVKSATEIWIQINNISHSMYNKIMSIAKLHKAPVRYFKSTSSERCAKQLANENKKYMLKQ